MVQRAVLIRERAWTSISGLVELVSETTIGSTADELDVGVAETQAIVRWHDGAWWVQPCREGILLDAVRLTGEVSLSHGQLISSADRAWRVRFLLGEPAVARGEHRHVEHVVDRLTRVLHRRTAYRRLETMTSGVVMLIDIDWMKAINDRYGMLAGDATLERTANVIRDLVRWPNLVARYGGEEFMVLMPEATLAQGRVLADQIRAAAEPSFAFEDFTLTATISIGLAAHTGQGTPALRAADEALILAKQQGRNRVSG